MAIGKECSRCGEYKALSAFTPARRSNFAPAPCTECRNGELQKYREMRPAYFVVKEARIRAGRLGVPFDLDQHLGKLDIRFVKSCEITGVPFRRGVGPRTWDSPSIDRIEPALGYVYTNVRVVLWMMNAALGTWGEDKLREVMGAWING